ncbi:hypothetical protein DB345_21095 [Spartobacteria bacterium LR76]|nr:hypothetical protein DB345_21095 [Spartobacteria bacterium LR76]
MSVVTASARLVQATKDLMLEWERTAERWQDAKGREFQETYLEELPQHIIRATEAIEEIHALLRKVKADCE